jgi:hypothetical protein
MRVNAVHKKRLVMKNATKKTEAKTGQKSGQKSDKKTSNQELLALGISKTTVDVYHVGNYKYENLDHALAEAKRFISKNE